MLSHLDQLGARLTIPLEQKEGHNDMLVEDPVKAIMVLLIGIIMTRNLRKSRRTMSWIEEQNGNTNGVANRIFKYL